MTTLIAIKIPNGMAGAGSANGMSSDYLTPNQVADLLNVNVTTVARWSLVDASMPVLRRGRVVRFHRERLMEWLQRQEPKGARHSAQRQHMEQGSAA
jgi:excisionase family DNA binding protein